jgi:hypothetical protein
MYSCKLMEGGSRQPSRSAEAQKGWEPLEKSRMSIDANSCATMKFLSLSMEFATGELEYYSQYWVPVLSVQEEAPTIFHIL